MAGLHLECRTGSTGVTSIITGISSLRSEVVRGWGEDIVTGWLHVMIFLKPNANKRLRLNSHGLNNALTLDKYLFYTLTKNQRTGSHIGAIWNFIHFYNASLHL
ncbi:hypothetical protein [Myxosarcina sp. GI1(2024)]